MYSEGYGWSSTSTAIGGYQRLLLSDGSMLELNTSSEVRYRLSETLRELEVAEGEAHFRVAHDAERPFVVVARDTVIRSVGTEFTVRIRDDGKVEVVVAGGVVAESRRARQSALNRLLHGRVVPLEGGTAVPEKRIATDDGKRLAVVEMSRAGVEAHDAWRSDMLIFEGTPLREIVKEFNRYDRRKLEIADPAIRDVLLGGKYRPREVEGFLQNLGAVMKIRVVEGRSESGEGVVLRIYSDTAKPNESAR
jgi:transmembrane sensor